MINNNETWKEVHEMPKAKSSTDMWDEILDSLVLDTEPPKKYIKDAIIVTKNGTSYKLSADDFADLVAREKNLPPEQSEIQHCSVSIDFTRIKRDVNKWSLSLINAIESNIEPIKLGQKRTSTKKTSTRKKVVSKQKRKID